MTEDLELSDEVIAFQLRSRAEGFEEGYKEGFRRGYDEAIQRGSAYERISIARKLLKTSLSIRDIAHLTRVREDWLETQDPL